MHKVRTVNPDTFFDEARIDIERRLKDIVGRYKQHEKLGYILNHGKRLRPLLSILAFRACGGDESNYQNALDLAAAIELQHSASLVHDDIIDGDGTRRNKSSYYGVFGVEDAVLTGHRAILLGFRQVLRQDRKILKTFFDVWDMSLEGEIEDVASRKSPLLTFDKHRYFDVIVNKTASLFAGAAKIGSQLATVDEDLQNLFWEYGKYIGIAYQLADDKLDLAHGNPEALPVSWIARTLDGESLKSLTNSLRKGLSPSAALSKLDVDVESMFNEEIAKMQRAAEDLATSKIIPENKFSSLLSKAPEYMINRSMKS